MQKNSLSQLALALFIGLIFISTYISLTNYNSSQQTSTTTVPPTAFAEGFAEGTIIGYGTPLYFNATCSNTIIQNASITSISNSLDILQKNNSISSFYPSGESIIVAPQNMNAYQINDFINETINATESKCISSFAMTYVRIPGALNLTANGQKILIPVPANSTNESIILNPTYKQGSTIRLKVSTLLTANGTIYGPINIVVLK